MSDYPPQPPRPPEQPLDPIVMGPPQPLPYARGVPGGKPCPQCGQQAALPVKFTWWGGALGPRMFSHHKCKACAYTFNGKTGLPNTTAITIYVVISAVVGLAAAGLVIMSQH